MLWIVAATLVIAAATIVERKDPTENFGRLNTHLDVRRRQAAPENGSVQALQELLPAPIGLELVKLVEHHQQILDGIRVAAVYDSVDKFLQQICFHPLLRIRFVGRIVPGSKVNFAQCL